MSKTILVKKINDVIATLPAQKLETLYELAVFFQKQRQKESRDFFAMQMGSKAYKEWVSAENDIYDEIL